MPVSSYHSRVLIPLFENQSTAGTTGVIDVSALSTHWCVYVVWSGTPTAGQVVIETAHEVGYTGTWHILATSNFAANKVEYFAFEGVVAAVRARISTAVAGGTVSVYLAAN